MEWGLFDTVGRTWGAAVVNHCKFISGGRSLWSTWSISVGNNQQLYKVKANCNMSLTWSSWSIQLSLSQLLFRDIPFLKRNIILLFLVNIYDSFRLFSLNYFVDLPILVVFCQIGSSVEKEPSSIQLLWLEILLASSTGQMGQNVRHVFLNGTLKDRKHFSI